MSQRKDTCIFCDIAKNKINHFQFWSDKKNVAFLDSNPTIFGHTLVIPKNHVDYIFKLSRKDYIDLFLATKKIAEVLQKKTGCKRVGLVITGFQIPHTHIHLLPMNRTLDLNRKMKRQNKKKMQVFADELKQILIKN